jgi:hypothetical protein
MNAYVTSVLWILSAGEQARARSAAESEPAPPAPAALAACAPARGRPLVCGPRPRDPARRVCRACYRD